MGLLSQRRQQTLLDVLIPSLLEDLLVDQLVIEVDEELYLLPRVAEVGLGLESMDRVSRGVTCQLTS